MFLRAGALSLGLLVLSRLLGLVRESAQAAAFGATGLGDVAVLMLALPDWIAGLLAAGALSYVLLPAWARDPAGVAALQRRVAWVLLGIGAGVALLVAVARGPALDLLAAGLKETLRPAGMQALVFSAFAIPLSLLAALWTTRLQHEREFVGMYAANLVVNGVLVAALWFVAGRQDLTWLGVGLLVAMAARLGWLAWKMAKVQRQSPAHMARSGVATNAQPQRLPDEPATGSPTAATWTLAALAAGLPLALPFVARSLASQSGEGALATFNYAWKLVELPLMLAIQLVATLAFPAIARAVAANEGTTAIRNGFALAWTLACASAAGLVLAAPALAELLFGWGRMQPEALVNVADWGRIGAWGLLPQACIAVGVTVLAACGRMAPAVLAYAAGLAVLLFSGFEHGHALMVLMNLVLIGVAIVVIVALGRWRDVPWRTFAVAFTSLLACDVGSRFVPVPGMAGQLAMAVVGGVLVIGVTAAASPEVRAALRR
ncbi:lipid II flippase MurJ [Ramlibacter albus]|uniref:Virulence factor MviN n=1 Tax=Ramlibacter albus TaxID=2079448 RepID=A0A923ME70_9BURK|nr:lipid II flippase MurJ [Ramlibacter albus]MBC5768385.1 hypothetical protein [Ramlibacter albus]